MISPSPPWPIPTSLSSKSLVETIVGSEGTRWRNDKWTGLKVTSFDEAKGGSGDFDNGNVFDGNKVGLDASEDGFEDGREVRKEEESNTEANE